MSASDDAVMGQQAHIQDRIDQRPLNDRFTFEDLFDDEQWRNLTRHDGRELALARSVTNAFKRRILGFPGAREPVFSNVRWTGDINVNGRTVNFQRIEGDHQEANR